MVTANDSKARTFSELRDILGYVENGTDVSVRIYQDDATRTWHVHVGQKGYYADSLQAAIRKAHQVHHELLDPVKD